MGSMAWVLLLGAAGMALVVSTSTAGALVRWIWPKMMGCPLCCGVWCGWLWAGAGARLAFWDYPAGYLVVYVLAHGFAAALVAHAVDTLVCLVREHREGLVSPPTPKTGGEG